MGKRSKAEAELPWKDIEVSTPRGIIERVSLAVMEVRATYTAGDSYTYAGPPQYVVTAWVADDLDRHRKVNLRCKKLRSGIVYQVGDSFRTPVRATAELAAIKDGKDWEAWRWLELEEVRS